MELCDILVSRGSFTSNTPGQRLIIDLSENQICLNPSKTKMKRGAELFPELDQMVGEDAAQTLEMQTFCWG